MGMTLDATQVSNFAPIDTEYDLPALKVTGALPRGLNGTLFRNGPNPHFPSADPARDHWFAGDGMVHAFTVADGRASYRNRWVRTAKWVAEDKAGRSLVPGFGGPELQRHGIADTGVANTNIIWHAGRLLALEEGHLPFELDPASLATQGVQNFGPLRDPFTAHPKTDPLTGELIFFGCYAGGMLAPTMSYGVLDADGRVKRLERFEAPYCAMVHDFAVTETQILFPVMPLTGSLKRAMAGKPVFAWEPDLGAHIGVLDRAKGVASLRWFRAESCFVFHLLNAWDQDGRIVADVMQSAAPPFFPRADGSPIPDTETTAHLVRWTLDPRSGTDSFTRTQLDDLPGEFPRLDERRAGQPNRHGLFVGQTREKAGFDTIAWHDFGAGRRDTFTLPGGDALAEAVFVPRQPGAPEGDGWLLSVAWRPNEGHSDLIILDTQAIGQGPVATIHLPHRVPFGFHGNWVDTSAMSGRH